MANQLTNPASGSKARTRKGGAAVPLDETDKRLLNLLQGSFPLDPRPFAKIAAAAGIGEEEVLARTKRLVRDRIIRQITPIYDTRALGYTSLLVAAKVDPDHPWRAAKVINEHPGVSHNYQRNHEFNLWFTIAVPPDSKLGVDQTLEILKERSGATSMRKLPTLRMFKIRMDLEMEGGTEALAAPQVVAEYGEPGAVPYDERDVAVIKATQGYMEVVPEPYAKAAADLGIEQERLLDHLQELQERSILRRVAAILFHRRAGYSANGMGVWKVPKERVEEVGPVMASFRGISHCYERPTYPDWPYALFTMCHGRSVEECERVLGEIAARTGITERAVLYSSTEFKKVRLLYFTDDYAAWERTWGGV